ncbi:hypothetical protein TWF281_003260 [Arthrobotrys megalospora]
MDLDSKAVMLFRVFTAQESYDAVPKAVSKTRALYVQDASYFQHALKFQRHDRILVPLDNLTYECPVGINERTGEVGNLCLDRVTPVEGVQQFRIHGVFTEYGSTKPTQGNQSPSKLNEFPPTNLPGPRWQYHYGDPFLLRPDFSPTSSGGQDNGGVRKVNVFNLRTGEPLSVPLTKVRLHPNYRFKGSGMRIIKTGIDSSSTKFRGGQLLTVAVLGGRNVRLGGKATSSLLFCLATGSGAPSWVFENQIEALDTDFMRFANHTSDWLTSDMEDNIQEDLEELSLRDIQVMYANLQTSSADSSSNWAGYQQERYRGDGSDLEDASGEDDSEDGDIQFRGMLSQTSYGGGREYSRYHSRGGMPPTRTSRQSSTNHEINYNVRVAMDPGGRGQVRRTALAPVQSDGASRRGRTPVRVPRTIQHAPPPEEQSTPSHTRNPRWAHAQLTPTPDHFDFLGDRVREEGERLRGMELARYNSREREHHGDELGTGQSAPRAPHDLHGDFITDTRSRSRGYDLADTEHLGSHYQRNHPRRSPPVGDGY